MTKIKGEKKMKEISKIRVVSCARLLAFVMAIMGFFAGIFAAFFSITPGRDAFCLREFCPLYSGLSFWAIIIFPIVYAIIGLICGGLGATIYNISARWVGGIEIDLKNIL
jgi:hypothetical protein